MNKQIDEIREFFRRNADPEDQLLYLRKQLPKIILKKKAKQWKGENKNG